MLLYIFISSLGPLVSGQCPGHQLVRYDLTLTTLWSQDTFPRQYPEWRPPAQWSKLLGYSHSSSFHVYHVGQPSSVQVQQFIEGGSTEGMDRIGQAEPVLDLFIAPPIDKGVGQSKTTLMVDGNHSMISFISKIIPSPDWFIGLDSLNLCNNGSWSPLVEMNVDLLDGGTDNGFTFTSPNYPTLPPGPVHKITNIVPDHPAGSFHYPALSSLPPIATVQLTKVKEFTLKKTFAIESKPLSRRESKPLSRKGRKYSRFHYDMLNDQESPSQNSTYINGIERDRKQRPKKSVGSSLLNLLDKSSLYDQVIQFYKKDKGFRKSIKKIKKLRREGKKTRRSRDCIVGPWSSWSPCSVTCGIGEEVRKRKVTRKSRGGGRRCPKLKEVTWCGSARNCHGQHFRWGDQL